MNATTIKLLYGHRVGEPSYTEQILCSQSERFDEVKRLATLDGWTGFRVAIHRDGEKPDFVGALNIRKGTR